MLRNELSEQHCSVHRTCSKHQRAHRKWPLWHKSCKPLMILATWMFCTLCYQLSHHTIRVPIRQLEHSEAPSNHTPGSSQCYSLIPNTVYLHHYFQTASVITVCSDISFVAPVTMSGYITVTSSHDNNLMIPGGKQCLPDSYNVSNVRFMWFVVNSDSFPEKWALMKTADGVFCGMTELLKRVWL